MSVRIDPTAWIEAGVDLGTGTRVRQHAHLSGPATVGQDCAVGAGVMLGAGVAVADRAQIEAGAHVCPGVTIETGVYIGPGVIMADRRYPRATTPDLSAPRPDLGQPSRTVVAEGASIGAGAMIGADLQIGRFAMVGMGAVVTHHVPDFHIAAGNPARTIGFICRCGEPLLRFAAAMPVLHIDLICSGCQRRYAVRDGDVTQRSAARNIIPFRRVTQ